MSEEERQEGREPELRKIEPEELQRTLAEHEKWVKSEGKAGARARLYNADLSKVTKLLRGIKLESAVFMWSNLQGVDLRQAVLKGATIARSNMQWAVLLDASLQGARLNYSNLRGANLKHADLRNAKLVGANLSEAYLADANLKNANLSRAALVRADLTRANLTGADLRYADLTDAILLDATPLAGQDLTGTRLPADIAKFEGLANVKEAATKASHLFTILLLGCLYAWLTVGTGFMGEAKEDKLGLPFIYNAYISREGFSLAAPLFLLGLYGYLHIYLQRLWEHLALLPAIFPDGTTLDKKATPWLFLGYVRAHVPKLRAQSAQPMDRMQTCLIQLAAYWLVPLTLAMFWWDSMGQGSQQGAVVDALLGLTGLGLGYWFMSLAAATLSGRIGHQPTNRTRAQRGLRQALADNMVEVAWFLLGVVPLFAALTYFRWPA